MRAIGARKRLNMITKLMLDLIRGLPRMTDNKHFNGLKVFKELRIKAPETLFPG